MKKYIAIALLVYIGLEAQAAVEVIEAFKITVAARGI